MGERASGRSALDAALAIVGTIVPLAAIGATMLEAALDILPATGLIDRLTLARVLIVLAVVALLVAGARIKDFRTGADIPIGLLVVAAAFTTVQGGWDGAPLRFLITAIATYYVVVATIRRLPNARSAIALVALASIVATAGLGIAQVAEESFTGFYRDGLEPITSEIVRPDLQVRAIGSFINPNLLASFLVLLGPIGLVTAAWIPRREMRWAVFGLAALAYIGLVLTFSRSAVLGAILGGLLVILLLPAASPIRKAAIWTAAGLAVAAIAAAALTSGRAVGAFGRIEAWNLALEAAADEPVNGVGLGRSGDVIVVLGGTDETFAHAHNLWLNWLTEAGPLAFLAIAFFSIWLVVEAARGTRRGDAFLAAALAGMVGFFVISLTDHPANTERIAITFWILAGVIAASGAPSFLAPWLGGPDDDEVERRPPPVLLAGAAAAAPPVVPVAVATPLPEPDPGPQAPPAPDTPEEAVEAPTPEPVAQEPLESEAPSASTAAIPVIGQAVDRPEEAGALDTEPEPEAPADEHESAGEVAESEPEIAVAEPESVVTPLFARRDRDAEAGEDAEPEPGGAAASDAAAETDAGAKTGDDRRAPAPEPESESPIEEPPLADTDPGDDVEPLPPLLAGVDPGDGWPNVDDDAADTGEMLRPPELTQGSDEPASAEASEAKTEPEPSEEPEPTPEVEAPADSDEASPDITPIDEAPAPAPAADEPTGPPALFFDQDSEPDATSVGPLGAPPPEEDPEPEVVAFYDHAAEPSPPLPDPMPPSEGAPEQAIPSGESEPPADSSPVESVSGEAIADERAPAPEAEAEPEQEEEPEQEAEPAPETEAARETETEVEEPERRGGVSAWITFESVADELRADPAVTSSTMLAAPSLRREGTYFAALWHDSRLAVKLPLARSRALIDEGAAEEFAPAGRILDEWVLVSPESREQWRELLEEAKAHAADS